MLVIGVVMDHMEQLDQEMEEYLADPCGLANTRVPMRWWEWVLLIASWLLVPCLLVLIVVLLSV